MTHEPDLDLDSLRDAWQTDTGPAWADLRRDLEAALRRARLSFAIEALIATLGVTVGVVVLVGGDWALGSAALLFSAFGGGAAVYANWQAWRVPVDTVTAELHNMTVAARQRRKAAWAGIAVCSAALLFLASVIAFAPPDFSSPTNRLLVAGAVVFVAVSVIFSARMLAHSIAREDRIRELKERYSDGDSTS
ncbi:MAG: hypothetical protein AAFN78_12350 [Pseudomonadota bacterium]